MYGRPTHAYMLASGSHSAPCSSKNSVLLDLESRHGHRVATKREVAKYASMRFNDQLGKLATDWIDQSRLLILNPSGPVWL